MGKDQLNILWTNADPVTSELMVFMYACNAKKRGLWENVQVIIWGATAGLVAKDLHIQQLIREAQKDGVNFSACIACADRLRATQTLQELGIEVKSWGVPLTQIIKTDEHLITV